MRKKDIKKSSSSSTFGGPPLCEIKFLCNFREFMRADLKDEKKKKLFFLCKKFSLKHNVER